MRKTAETSHNCSKSTINAETRWNGPKTTCPVTRLIGTLRGFSGLLPRRFVQFRNSFYRPIEFLSDTRDFVHTASQVSVHRTFHVRGEALSHPIFPKRICPVFFLLKDVGKFKTTYGVIRVYFESIEQHLALFRMH